MSEWKCIWCGGDPDYIRKRVFLGRLDGLVIGIPSGILVGFLLALWRG